VIEAIRANDGRDRCITEVETNLQHARDYLAAKGVVIPW
jgi:hypothetical protein